LQTYNQCLFVWYLASVALGYGWISDTEFQKFSDKDWIWICKNVFGYGSGVEKSISAHLCWAVVEWSWHVISITACDIVATSPDLLDHKTCKCRMTTAMTSSSSAILGIDRLTSSFARKVYEQMVALIQSRSLELCYQTFKTCQFNESRLLIFQEKKPQTCTFHGWWMMLWKQGALKIFKCWNPVVVFPSPNKISGYSPGCTTSIYQKILWFVFDLIYVVIVSSSIYRNWPNFNWLPQFFSTTVYLSSQN